MLRVYACITHEHDPRLVLVAAIICFLGALTALSAFEHARWASSRRPFWIAVAASVAGFGIWATHFVAMLAYKPELPIGYNLFTTLLSVCAAIGVTGLGWALGLGRHRLAPAAAGALIGAGISTMHYIGMAAVIVAGEISWNLTLVAASVICGIGMGAAALALQCRKRQQTPWLPAILLTVAICGMHFTGMAAATLYPDPRIAVPVESIDSATLAIVVTAAALLILFSGFGLILFDRGLTRTQLAEARKRADLADEVLKGAAEREVLTDELKRQAGITSAALNHMAQGLSMYDEHNRLVICNPCYAALYGLPPELLKEGTPFQKIIESLVANGTFSGTADEHIEDTHDPGSEPGQREVRLGNGRIIDIQFRPLPGGGWLATHEDVTEKRQAAARIAYLAAHDALTGLPNRVTLSERLKAAASSARRGRGFAVLTVDLDRFKEVNDTLGHPIGDEILKQASIRLAGLLREDDVVTRLGGDEFAILQAGAGKGADAEALASRVVEALGEPFQFDGHTVAIGASIGISLAPADGIDADELLKKSDLALYRAKSDSRGSYRFFETGMDSRLRERRELESDLRTAIQEGQFEVHYQPLLELSTGTIRSFEALVRWRHPERGLIQPLDFIGIAEESGLIIPIGEWVLRQACRDAAAWPEDVGVAVNLSAAQFKRGDLLAMAMSALAAAGLAPERLELEITESVLLHDEAWVRSVLEKLTAFGVRIAMDDFGTGYSSLSYLRTFPFSKIKIDRSFVEDLVGTTDARAIVHATIQLSQKLGMETTAEGVETAEQMAILVSEGCKQVQGFHVSRPVPAPQVAGLLRRYNDEAEPLRAAS
jgi:diguanylate cyclase (GGDEF)-like protein